MTRRSTLMVTVTAAVVLLIWVGVQAQQAARANPTAVAVVDIEAVFNQLKQKQAIEADLRAQGDRLLAEENTKKERIRSLQSQLEMLPPGSPGHNTKLEEVQKALLELQVWGQFQQQKQQRERGIQIEALYNKATKTIGDIARESGYDLVLFKEPTPNLEGANLQQVMAQLSLRKVLWARDGIDLTQTVVTRMNTQFDAGQ